MSDHLPSFYGMNVTVSHYLCTMVYQWKPKYLLPLGKSLYLLEQEKCPGKSYRVGNELVVCQHVKEALDRGGLS